MRRASKPTMHISDLAAYVLVVEAKLEDAAILASAIRLSFHLASGLAAAKRRLPLIGIIDLGLPDGDGCELARHIRWIVNGHHVALIAYTGWQQSHVRLNALAAGFDEVVLKGASFQELAESMRKCACKRYSRRFPPPYPLVTPTKQSALPISEEIGDAYFWRNKK